MLPVLIQPPTGRRGRKSSKETDNHEIYKNHINIYNILPNKIAHFLSPSQSSAFKSQEKLFSYLCNKLKFQDLFLTLLLYTSRIFMAKNFTLHVLKAQRVSANTENCQQSILKEASGHFRILFQFFQTQRIKK